MITKEEEQEKKNPACKTEQKKGKRRRRKNRKKNWNISLIFVIEWYLLLCVNISEYNILTYGIFYVHFISLSKQGKQRHSIDKDHI